MIRIPRCWSGRDGSAGLGSAHGSTGGFVTSSEASINIINLSNQSSKGPLGTPAW